MLLISTTTFTSFESIVHADKKNLPIQPSGKKFPAKQAPNKRNIQQPIAQKERKVIQKTKIFTPQEKINNRNLHFFKEPENENNFLNVDSYLKLRKNKKLIGEGGCGKVFAFKWKGKEYVEKRIKGSKSSEIYNEYNKIEKFKDKINEKKNLDDIAEIQAADGVVTPIALQGDSIIQPRISGNDGWDLKKIPYYANTAFSNDPSSSKLILLQLAAELMAIHATDHVHCDIKLDNIMIHKGFKGPEAHIIDLDFLTPVGKNNYSCSKFGNPKLHEHIQKADSLYDEVEDLKKILKPMSGNEPDYSDKYNEYSAKYDELESLKQNCSAKKSRDIYSFGTLFIPILFGSSGFDLSFDLFKSWSENYIQQTSSISSDDYEGRVEFFKQKLIKLNQRMKQKTKKGYSEQEIELISELLAWMMDLEESHRPDIKDIFGHLQRLFK